MIQAQNWGYLIGSLPSKRLLFEAWYPSSTTTRTVVVVAGVMGMTIVLMDVVSSHHVARRMQAKNLPLAHALLLLFGLLSATMILK